MEPTTRPRSELKSYFVRNAIPTEDNFADLIDGMLNLKEDRLFKDRNSPLSLEGAGDDASQKPVLSLYQDFDNTTADWVFNLNPFSTPNESSTARPGFNIADGANNSRLFIDQDTGNVGIGTLNPYAKLSVNGSLGFTNSTEPMMYIYESGTNNPERPIIAHSPPHQNWGMSYRDQGDILLFQGNGQPVLSLALSQQRVGVGTTDPSHIFHVVARDAVGLLESTGTQAYLRLSTKEGLNNRVEIANRPGGRLSLWTAGGGDVLNITKNGNVGIGTTEPAERLHINGYVRGNQKGALRLSTGDGHVDIGPKNKDWSHFNTDRSKYYFDKEIRVDSGNIGSYNDNLYLRTEGSTRVTVLKSNGSVGIGTTSPNHKLHVNGETRTSSITISSGGKWWHRKGGDAAIVNDKGGYNALMIVGADYGTGKRLVSVWDTLTVHGTKNFMIDHPLDPNHKYLVHSTLEGPEAAVFYRGEGQLTDGQTTILLPKYFEALTRTEGRTILLTPKFEGESNQISRLAASNVTNGKFSVRMIDKENPSQKFYWEVKAVRADVEILEVEEVKEFAHILSDVARVGDSLAA